MRQSASHHPPPKPGYFVPESTTSEGDLNSPTPTAAQPHNSSRTRSSPHPTWDLKALVIARNLDCPVFLVMLAVGLATKVIPLVG